MDLLLSFSRDHLSHESGAVTSHGLSEPSQIMRRTYVQELLEKRVLEQVKDPKSLGFYSLLFLVLKKNGKLRPIIDLRRLTRHRVIPSFMIESGFGLKGRATWRLGNLN